MRKLILTMIFSLAAGIAKADVMLYWTVDPSLKDTYSYAVIYGVSGENLSDYTALDAVTSGSAIDTNVSLGSGSMYENYIVRLFDLNYKYLSSCYTYADLAANVWATDMLSMKATTPAVFRAVPEPTSGLLLLLGVAGLALKRKRA